MAHKTVEAAIASIKKDQTFRGIIIVWRKDWERWPTELLAAATADVRFTPCEPHFLTKNQVVIAEDKVKVAEANAIAAGEKSDVQT